MMVLCGLIQLIPAIIATPCALFFVKWFLALSDILSLREKSVTIGAWQSVNFEAPIVKKASPVPKTVSSGWLPVKKHLNTGAKLL